MPHLEAFFLQRRALIQLVEHETVDADRFACDRLPCCRAEPGGPCAAAGARCSECGTRAFQYLCSTTVGARLRQRLACFQTCRTPAPSAGSGKSGSSNWLQ